MSKTKLLGILAVLLLLVSSCAHLDDPEGERQSQIERMNEEKATLAEEEINGKPLSLQRCLEIAMRNNYKVRQARLAEEIAMREKGMSFANFMPKVTVSAGYTEWDRAPRMQGMQTSDKNYFDAGVSASMPLLAPSIWLLYANAATGQEQAALAGHIVRQAITLQVTEQFYECLIAEDQVTTLESQVQATKSQFERINGLGDEGLVRKWEKDYALLEYRTRETALASERRNLMVMKSSLAMSMGLPPLTEFSLERDNKEYVLPEMNTQEIVFEALSRHPELSIADRNVVQSENAVRIAIANFIPVVGAAGRWNWTDDSFTEYSHNLLYQFTGVLDVFNGFKDYHNYKKAKLAKTSAELNRDALMLSIILEVVRAEADLRDAYAYAQLSVSSYETCKAKYEDYIWRCKEGLEPIYELLDARAEMDVAQALMVRRRYTSFICQASLEMAMGTIVPPEVVWTPEEREKGGKRPFGATPDELLLPSPTLEMTPNNAASAQ